MFPKESVMPTARMSYSWAHGDEIELEIHVEDAFPDSVNEAVVQIMALYRSAVLETAVSDADE